MDPDSEDDYFERMCAAAPCDEMDVPVGAEGACESVGPTAYDDQAYYEAMADQSTGSIIQGEDSLVWQSLLRTQSAISSSERQSLSFLKGLIAANTPSRLLLLSQWLFSQLPQSSMVHCEVQRLAANLLAPGDQSERDLVFCYADHFQHPSMVVVVTQKRKAGQEGDLHICLFSSLPLTSVLASEVASLIGHFRKKKRSFMDLNSAESQVRQQRVVVAGLDVWSCGEALRVALCERGIVVAWTEPAPLWSLHDGCAANVTVPGGEISLAASCGWDYEIVPLTLQDASTIDFHWKYRSDSSLDRIRGMLVSADAGLPALGVRARALANSNSNGNGNGNGNGNAADNGELVAWVLTNHNGSIGMLHTLEAHRHRGLAKALVVLLLPLWMSSGGFNCPPFCYIHPDNQASMRVFSSLGFQKKADVEWLGLDFSFK